jgi:hypothetical protein
VRNNLEISEYNFRAVDTVFSMVTCRMMIHLKIRFVLYDLQNNKHCVGGANDPLPMPKSDDRLNMSRVIFRSIE